MGKTAITLLHLSFRNAFSAQLFWYNSCCFSQLIYRSLTQMTLPNRVPPTKALTDSLVSPTGETAIDSIGEQRQTFESLDKNSNVAGDSQVWNQASEMCTELQTHFTKEDFLQLRREWNWGLSQHSVRGFPTGIHCALLHSPVISLLLSQWGLYVESGVRYIIQKNPDDRFMSMGTHILHACLVFTSVPVFLSLPICLWMWAEELPYKKEDSKHKSKAKIDGGIQWHGEGTE